MSEPVNVMLPMTMSRTVATLICGGGAAADRVEQRDQLRHRRHLHGPRAVEAGPSTDHDPKHDDGPAEAVERLVADQELSGKEVDRRRHDRDRHPGGRQEVAVPSRCRRVHPHEAKYERRRAREPREANED
jgi:hypothetical protein